MRSVSRVVPLVIGGPPVTAGSRRSQVSCTYRSLTSDGGTITASAAAGTRYFASYSNSTTTVPPAGVTLSMVPTLTPRIRTSEPG